MGNRYVQFTYPLSLLLVIAFSVITVLNGEKAKKGYSDSYAFLNVQSPLTPKDGVRFCVNFQQYKDHKLPATVNEAKPLRLSWWNNKPKLLDVCQQNSKKFLPNEIFPSLYQTEVAKSKCKNATESQRNFFIRHQINIMEKSDVSQALFLMQKGEHNFYGYRDYLFLQFSNPEIKSDDLLVFYMYHETFFNKILPLIPTLESNNETMLRFYRPEKNVIDCGVILFWFFAVVCIFFGSLWGSNETKIKLNYLSSEQRCPNSKNMENEDKEIKDRVGIVGKKSSLNIVLLATKTPPANTTSNESKDLPQLIINKKAGDVIPTSQPTKGFLNLNQNNDIYSQESTFFLCAYVIFLVVFVSGVLLLAFFFRDEAVTIFNIFLVFLGTLSVYECFYCLLQLCFSCTRINAHKKKFDVELFSLSQLFCITKCYNRQLEKIGNDVTKTVLFLPSYIYWWSKLARSSLFSTKIQLLSLLVFCLSAALCITWFFWRENPYAFVLLDFINACLCINVIRMSAYRSLRFLTFLLMGMFAYDMFMVFGTRLLTASGCSVMVQVVTGTDCQSQKVNNLTVSYPVPPVGLVVPKMIPVAFYIPFFNNPIGECVDVEVENGFKHMMLGLGDVVMPGFLVAYCFYIDVIKRNRFYSFGLLSLSGYSFGMIATLIALRVMNTAQPALIYLVPFTLIPVLFYSWRRGIAREVWIGGSELMRA